MSENRNMHSTARRIARGFLLRTLLTVFIIDLLVAASVVLAFCLSGELAALGDAWQPELLRRLAFPANGTLFDRLRGAQYVFSLPGSTPHVLPAGPFLLPAAISALALLGAEAVVLTVQHRGARKRVMRLMAPLRQMAEAAREFSRVRFDERKAHQLEDAIESLSVQSPSARVFTGDSELMGLETAVNKLVQRMHEAYRQQIRFVSDASHELRTPIAVIRGYAGLLSRWGKDDPKVMEEAVAAIRDEADNMQRLVEQLLYLARGDAGRTPFTPTRVMLDELVREAFEEYELIDKTHAWKIRLDGSIAARGDEAMLKQLLRVLADNALKFSPPGTAITLRAFVSEKGLPAMSVQDNGPGIAAADLPHIFERFYRSDPARVKGGTGLGLSIAKWIADRHDGFIDVYSSPGLGSRFTVSLPPDVAVPPGGAPAKDGVAQGV